MNSQDLLKEASAKVLARLLSDARGKDSVERMSEKCDISPRYYFELERHTHNFSSLTLLKLHMVGIDLEQWAVESLKLYDDLRGKHGLLDCE